MGILDAPASLRLNDRGAWAAATAYKLGDVATAPNGDRVTPKATFTSAASYDGTKWTVLAPARSGAYPLPAGMTGSNQYDPSRWLYNRTSSNLRRALAKLAQAKANTGLCNIVCAGTSLTAGWDGLAPASGARPNLISWPVQLAQLLAARGIPLAGTGYVNPWANNNGTSRLTDSRWTYGSNWTSQNGTQGPLISTTTVGDVATFVSDKPGTIAELIYFDQNASAAFTVTVDGVDYPQTMANTSTMKRVQVIGLPNTVHTIAVKSTTTNRLFIGGAQVRNATGLLVHNSGVSSSASADWNLSPAYLNLKITTTSFYAPDLVFFEMQMNDALNGVDLTTYKANCATAIAAWQATGANVVLIVAAPPTTSVYNGKTVSAATWDGYRQASYALADTYNVPLIDLTDSLGLRTEIATNGLDTDGVHMSPAGYSAMALTAQVALVS